MQKIQCDNCHDGTGTLTFHVVADTPDSDRLLHIHDDILPPGVTIGEHPHHGMEEVYLVLDGNGTLIMDNQEIPVGPGDVSLCKSGHSHGLANTGKTPMHLIVIGVRL